MAAIALPRIGFTFAVICYAWTLIGAGQIIRSAVLHPLALVMLAGAARTYVNRYKAAPASRAVVVTSSDTAYGAALDLHAAGIHVAAIADLRPTADGPLPQAARDAGLRVLTGMRVLSTRGRRGLRVVILGHPDGRREWVRAGLLAMSGGWTPSVHLFSQSRGTLRFTVPGFAAFVRSETGSG